MKSKQKAPGKCFATHWTKEAFPGTGSNSGNGRGVAPTRIATGKRRFKFTWDTPTGRWTGWKGPTKFARVETSALLLWEHFYMTTNGTGCAMIHASSNFLIISATPRSCRQEN